MKQFTIYDESSGEILRTLLTSSDAPPIAEGQWYLEGAYDDLEYHVVNGVAVEKDFKGDALVEKAMAERPTLIEDMPVMDQLRIQRNGLLAQSDWTQVGDSPVDRVAWAAYRQELRNLPANYANISDINEVVWPEKPQV